MKRRSGFSTGHRPPQLAASIGRRCNNDRDARRPNVWRRRAHPARIPDLGDLDRDRHDTSPRRPPIVRHRPRRARSARLAEEAEGCCCGLAAPFTTKTPRHLVAVSCVLLVRRHASEAFLLSRFRRFRLLGRGQFNPGPFPFLGLPAGGGTFLGTFRPAGFGRRWVGRSRRMAGQRGARSYRSLTSRPIEPMLLGHLQGQEKQKRNTSRLFNGLNADLAEGVGFEPTIRFPVYTLSKRAPSATRPSLRLLRKRRNIAWANKLTTERARP